MHVPDDWAEAAARIVAGGVRRAVMLGSADVGKSTFCRFLVCEAQRAGRTVAFLDADVGQKTVGPPACVTLANAGGTRLAFVGTTNPIFGWPRLVAGIRHLASAGADLLIANTSGILTGAGRRLKAGKIEVIGPDLLVALGAGADLDLLLGDHGHLPVLRLSQSSAARRKTKAERRAARREAFRRYFREAPVRALDRAALGDGHRYPPGLLLGLGDRSVDLGLGILVGYPSPASVAVLTPVAGANIDRITPGLVCLDESFRDIAAPTIATPQPP